MWQKASKYGIINNNRKNFLGSCQSPRTCAGPSRATAGPRKALSWGPITVSFLRRDLEAKCAERKETWGGRPLNIRLGVWGSVVSSSSGPRPKMNFMHIEVRKKPSGTPFSVFLSDGGAPKCQGARENFPPSPLSTGLCLQHLDPSHSKILGTPLLISDYFLHNINH